MGTSEKVLIVDDNATNRLVLARVLKKDGYEVLEAQDGFVAVDLAKAHSPVLILLDIMMPGRDGFEVCEILKSSEATAAIPIIFLSAKTEAEDLDKAFSLGGSDYITKPFRVTELRARISVHLQLRQAQTELLKRNKQLEGMTKIVAETNIELARLGRIDRLTGLLNRGAFEETAMLEHERSGRNSGRYSLIMIDVDHFKAFNDTFGHQAGDECLKKVAKCLSSSCRSTDLLGRYGGEEFVVLASDSDEMTTVLLAERMRESLIDLRLPHPANSVADYVTVSLGVAESAGDSWEAVLKKADDALYAAKKRGRNCVVAASTGMAKSIVSTASEGVWRNPLSSELAEPDSCILIVDGDSSERDASRQILEKEGYRVCLATSSEEVTAELNRKTPDLVLMGLPMSDQEAPACLRQIKSDPATGDVPIIILGSPNEPKEVQNELAIGADDYVIKPVRAAELILRVRSMLDRRATRVSLQQSYEVRGEQSRLLSLLLDYCRALSAAEDLDTCLDLTISVSAELSGCRRVSVLLPDSQRKTLHVARATGFEEGQASKPIEVGGDSAYGAVFQSGRRFVINSATSESSSEADVPDRVFASPPSVCTALSVGGQVIGVLNVGDRVGGHPFETSELESIEMIAGIAGTALHAVLTRRARDQARDSIMIAFAKLAEHRDTDTHLHVDRVTRYCVTLARELRKQERFKDLIDDKFLYDFERAVPLHDIGKVAIPDCILLKPGRLTPQEMAVMRTHAQIGAETIRSVFRRAPELTMLSMAEDIASHHHEWYDGTGYPDGLKGDRIPIAARIVAVADVYDAVTSKRVYKKAMSHEEASAIVLKSSGTQFDPAVVEAFMQREADFIGLAQELSDVSEQASQTPIPEPVAV